jgi:Ca-activated chloride channel family protein
VKFEFPVALWLLAIVVPLSAALYVWAARRARTRLAGVVAARLIGQLVRSVDFRKRRLKALIFTLGLCALLAALARPQFGFEPVEVQRSSVDFLIALDLSRSMSASDVDGKPRLDAAKTAIGKLLDRLGADRVGLIAFAGEAFLAAPITEDHAAVQRNLDALETSSVAKPGSDIAAAIKLALKTFESGSYETKALVVVTDGEELQGDAVVAAREAALKGMSIFSVGVGSTAGARVPAERDGSVKFAKNEFGREVISRLNERVLQQIAASGRGSYEAFGKNGEGLANVWQRGLEPLGKSRKTKPSIDPREYFQWPLALAVALLLGEMLVNDRKRVRGVP